MKKILFMHKPLAASKEIFKDYEISFCTMEDSKNDIISKMKQVDIVVSSLDFKIDKEIYAACPNVKIINNFAVGYDNLDIESSKAFDVKLCNCPDTVTIATAEYTMATITALARKIVLAQKKSLESMCKTKEGLIGNDISFSNVGIIGAGKIGKKVASFLKPYEVNFFYHNRNKDQAFEKEFKAKYESLANIYKNCDIILLHCPLTEETTHLIDLAAFKAMKPTTFLINMSRGAVVETRALIEALKTNEIAGAAVDVYEEEPNVDINLINKNNILLSPHIAGLTVESHTLMYQKIKENIDAISSNKKTNSLLN